MVVSDRYHRQRLVEGIGDSGQEAISKANITIVGVGALGCLSATMLTRAGVGSLTLIDRDIVETTNLQRQLLFTEADAKSQQPKATAAAEHLRKINSEIQIHSYVEDLTARNIDRLLGDTSVIVDGLDNFHTRYLLNDYAIKNDVPYMFAGVIAGQGNAMTVLPSVTPCLRCLFPEPPTTGVQETCDTAGVLAPAIGIAASCQTMDVLKYISGNQDKISPTLLTFDLWNSVSNRHEIGNPDSDCICCSKHDYEFLNKQVVEPMVLCGRLAVQLPSIDGFNLPTVATKLQEHGEFSSSNTMIRGTFSEERGENDTPIAMLCFHDGRTIIHGTDDVKRAKAIFERYVGN
jgi:adenylyltransferase/sulfurtransferase